MRRRRDIHRLNKVLALSLLGMVSGFARGQSPAPLLVRWTPPATGSGRGTITLTINGYAASIRYGELSTAGSLASNFGGMLSQDVHSPVWAKGYPDGSMQMRLRSGSSVVFNSVTVQPDGGSPDPSSWGSIATNANGVGGPAGGPSITGLLPSTAQIGQSVIISGTNFGNSGASQVSLGGIPIGVLASSPSQITIQVPNGVTSGNIVVSVGGSASNGAFLLVSQSASCPTIPLPTFPN